MDAFNPNSYVKPNNLRSDNEWQRTKNQWVDSPNFQEDFDNTMGNV